MAAQLRVIFTLDHGGKKSMPKEIYGYVEPFKIAPNAKGKPDPVINMYRLVRDMGAKKRRKGLFIRLESIWRFIELIPRFGKECPTGWTCDNAIERASEFYLNCFIDLATYMEVYYS